MLRLDGAGPGSSSTVISLPLRTRMRPVPGRASKIFAGATGLEDRCDIVGQVQPRWNFAEATIDVRRSIGGTIPFRQGR